MRIETDVRARGAVKVGHEFQRGAFDHGADRQLHRFQRALAAGNIEDVAVQDVEHAGLYFLADDLLLVGDDIDDFQSTCVDQTQVERHVHHQGAAIGHALEAGILGVASIGVHARRADIVVQFGNAADDEEVGAGDLTGHDLAVIRRTRRIGDGVIGDQLVVGVFQLQFADRGIETLDLAGAGLGKRRHRHQRGALGNFAAAIQRGAAGVIRDAADGQTRRGQAMGAGIGAEAHQRI